MRANHKNNRHRIHTPIFPQWKICCHKMADLQGHYDQFQTHVKENLARLQGVRLVFVKHSLQKRY